MFYCQIYCNSICSKAQQYNFIDIVLYNCFLNQLRKKKKCVIILSFIMPYIITFSGGSTSFFSCRLKLLFSNHILSAWRTSFSSFSHAGVLAMNSLFLFIWEGIYFFYFTFNFERQFSWVEDSWLTHFFQLFECCLTAFGLHCLVCRLVFFIKFGKFSVINSS